jgi:hypothetical protein
LAYASGPNMECLVVTGDETPFGVIGGRITELWPMVGAQNVEARVGYRDQLGPTVTYGPWSARSGPGFCPVNERGRFFRFAVRIPAGEVWKFLQGGEIVGEQEGRRG